MIKSFTGSDKPLNRFMIYKGVYLIIIIRIGILTKKTEEGYYVET
jgi:hypothetical protein